MIFSFVFASMVTITAHASELPSHRVTFEIPEGNGTITKLQLDVVERQKKWIARVKGAIKTGTAETAEFGCDHVSASEFQCRRDDNGGAFELVLTPTPKLTTSYFSLDDEGEIPRTFLRPVPSPPRSFAGVKSPISMKDTF